MIAEAVMTWALLVRAPYSLVVVYFESKELCERAAYVVNMTDGNGSYAKTPCLQVRYVE